MDSSNAEKAWEEYATANAVRLSGFEREDFLAGRASRDAEVADLRQAQQEQWYQNDVTLAAKNKKLRRKLAAAEAVIARVRALCHTMDRGVGYRVSGDHSTWGEYHEGKSDFSGEVELLLSNSNESYQPSPDSLPRG